MPTTVKYKRAPMALPSITMFSQSGHVLLASLSSCKITKMELYGYITVAVLVERVQLLMQTLSSQQVACFQYNQIRGWI
jgi:hypothetical protein